MASDKRGRTEIQIPASLTRVPSPSHLRGGKSSISHMTTVKMGLPPAWHLKQGARGDFFPVTFHSMVFARIAKEARRAWRQSILKGKLSAHKFLSLPRWPFFLKNQPLLLLWAQWFITAQMSEYLILTMVNPNQWPNYKSRRNIRG